MAAGHLRTQADFLADCDPQDSAACQLLFADIGALAINLEGDKGFVALSFNFGNDVGWSLILKDQRLTTPASLLWGFPSHGVGNAWQQNGMFTAVADLANAGIPDNLIEAYGNSLEPTFNRPPDSVNWRSMNAGAVGAIHLLIHWPHHRQRIVNAIRQFVNNL